MLNVFMCLQLFAIIKDYVRQNVCWKVCEIKKVFARVVKQNKKKKQNHLKADSQLELKLKWATWENSDVKYIVETWWWKIFCDNKM